MKITIEVDITPEEALELFEGNIENLQKAMLNMFFKQAQQSAKSESAVIEFWQSMAEKSAAVFDQFQKKKEGKK